MDDIARIETSAPNSQSWRERAEHCRAMAQRFRSVEIRDRMLNVAVAYDRLAAQAGLRELESLERGKMRIR